MSRTTALAMPDGTLYFFSGVDQVRCPPGGGAPDPQEPIARHWPGLAELGFDDDLDAAVACPDGEVHFFSGSEYVRYDRGSHRAVVGQIADGWPGVFDKDLDAVVVWPTGKAYFFRDAEYTRVDLATRAVDPGYPRTIAAGWPGVFTTDLDAVLLLDGVAFFVSGDRYVRHDVASGRVVDDGPRAVGDGFPAVFGAGPARSRGAGAGGGPAGWSPLRRRAVELVTSVVPSGPGDAAFAEITADWTGSGSTSGALCHWLLWRLGCTDPTLVNRTAPAHGLGHVAGRDIARLYHGGTPPFVRWTPGAAPRPGDLVFVRGDAGGATEHVFVFLGEEFTADGLVWNTAEAGRTDTAGRQCAVLGRRRPLVGPGALRLSGDNPERAVVGWVDLDRLGL